MRRIQSLFSSNLYQRRGDVVAQFFVCVRGVVGGGDFFQDRADHGDFVAAVAFGAFDTDGPDFQREGGFVDDFEGEFFEEGFFVSEGEDAADAEALCFFNDGIDEFFADAFALGGGIDGEGADFGEVGPDDFQGTDAGDVRAPREFDGGDVEIAEGFVEFCVGAEEHFALLGKG